MLPVSSLCSPESICSSLIIGRIKYKSLTICLIFYNLEAIISITFQHSSNREYAVMNIIRASHQHFIIKWKLLYLISQGKCKIFNRQLHIPKTNGQYICNTDLEKQKHKLKSAL